MRKSRPRARPALGLTGLLGALGAAWAGPAGAAIVDFDDLTGKGGPFSGVCEASFQVDDEYLALGVQLSSNDPAVCVIAPGAGAPSPPNVGSGITSGNIDFSAPVIASFFDGGTPAAVGLVTLTLTPSSSSGTTVEAYDVNGLLLGSSGMTGPGTHTLYFPRRIHAARVDNGSFAVDDITFVDPVEPEYVPALGPLGLGILVALLAGLGAPRLGFGVRASTAGASDWALRPPGMRRQRLEPTGFSRESTPSWRLRSSLRGRPRSVWFRSSSDSPI